MKPGVVFLGRYRVIRALGEGPASEVFEAEDQRVPQRVAIKRLRQDLSGDPVWVTRFTREANVPILVGGDHVVKVHDDGVHGGVPFVVMELLDGVPLDRVIPAVGRLPAAVAMEIGARAAAALDAAHQRGLVHRNVKTANVFIARTAKGPEVKLLGFASEKALADARSDVAALGAVLYAALSGADPFDGGVPTLGASSPRAPIADLVRDLPEPVCELVTRSLAPNPRDRFQSARGFASAIEPLRDAAAFAAYPFFKGVQLDARESVAETTGVHVTTRSNRRELIVAVFIGVIALVVLVVLVAVSASNQGPTTSGGR